MGNKRSFKSSASAERALPTVVSGLSPFSATTPFAFISPLSYIVDVPDLSHVSEPDLVVSFKNLSKKDATTKAKALEDLDIYFSSHAAGSVGPEDATLEAWVKMYPRMTVDASRRVRQLAHQIQGRVAASSGKRFARHMAKVVGAWLAGFYDSDRLVARAAKEAFDRVFQSQEKSRAVWRAYQRPLLEFAHDALLKESVQTLSDERTVRPDEAEAKYARLVATALSLTAELIALLEAVDLEREEAFRRDFLHDTRVWAFAPYADSFVRRALYRLLRVCIEKDPDFTSTILKTLSTEFVAKGLAVEQIASASDFTDTLLLLTLRYPAVWTDEYRAKKSALTSLRQFLRRGSHAGPAEVWENISKLFENVPSALLPQDLPDRLALLEDLRAGINNRDESRMNVQTAWRCYFSVLKTFMQSTHEAEQPSLLEEGLLPLFEQFVKPSVENAKWSCGAHAMSIAVFALKSVEQVPVASQVIGDDWSRLTNLVIKDLQNSALQGSDDFESSQRSIAAAGERWVRLNETVLSEGVSGIRNSIQPNLIVIVTACIDLLKSQRGKPIGAAIILLAILRRLLATVEDGPAILPEVTAFFVDDLPGLYESASFAVLISCLHAVSASPRLSSTFQNSFQSTAKNILVSASTELKMQRLLNLLDAVADVSEQVMEPLPELEDYIYQVFQHSLLQDIDGWTLVSKALSCGSNILSPDLTATITSELMAGLALGDRTESALRGLEIVLRSNRRILHGPTIDRSTLLSDLFSLTESADEEVVVRAQAVNGLVEHELADQDHDTLNASLTEIILRQLARPTADSISVRSLVERAQSLYEAAVDRNLLAHQLRPPSNDWNLALVPFLDLKPDLSLTIMDPLAGTLSSIVVEPAGKAADISRDGEGMSAALRIGVYLTCLAQATDLMIQLTSKERALLLLKLLLTVQLANDNLNVPGTNQLWSSTDDPQTLEDFLAFVYDAQKLVARWLREDEAMISDLQEQLRPMAAGLSASAFYRARALTYISEESNELRAPTKSQLASWSEVLRTCRHDSSQFFRACALLVGNRGAMASNGIADRLCNELVSDLSEPRPSSEAQDTRRRIILLNAVIQHQDTASKIPVHRLVQLVKQFMRMHEAREDIADDVLHNDIVAEVLRALVRLVPLIQEVYGSHWDHMMSLIAFVWDDSANDWSNKLPGLHASLKLFGVLGNMRGANDDADDAWEQFKGPSRLISLLKHMPSHESDELHHPLKLVNSLLARQLTEFSPDKVEDLSELYHFMYAKSSSLQKAAYSLLHRFVPKAQEEVSIDVALEKSTARLAEELLSLVLEAPTLSSLADSSWDRAMPLSLRGYLLSWVIIFDHFVNSSYKVRSDYVANLKNGDYLSALLDFTFDFLGHDRGKPIDASRFDMTSYEIDGEESPERDAQWLLVHLYYLCLKHVPSLTKSWWIDRTGRQKAAMIESWTEKYISPQVIGEELTTVTTWVSDAASGQDDEDGPLVVKVSKVAREVTAGYEVDEQMMQMVIKLPGAYPLRQATVEGLHRVGVDEKKWRSWLINAQGVITFSNGSIVDGLTAWRKNVAGTLRGQTECAICYSIISADKQLPSKRCSTCKNLFHSSK